MINEDMDKFDNIITLNDANGKAINFELLDLIKHEGEEYAVLLPVEQAQEDEGETVILKIEQTENDNEESYVSVEDADELDAVFTIFKDKYKKQGFKFSE